MYNFSSATFFGSSVEHMKTVTVRKSGGAYIVTIPAFAISQQHIEIGTELNFELDGDKMILSPIKDELTLDEVLAASPKSRLKVTEEDKAWESATAIGKEI